MAHFEPRTFAKALPALRKIADEPVSKVNPPRSTLREVAQKLLKVDTSTPDYWPTVLRFIQFASAGLTPDVPPPGTQPQFVSHSRMPPGSVAWPPMSHTVIVLDGGEVSDLRADHSRIIFTRNPVKMTNVVFTDCVFEMPSLDQPDPFLQQASRTILASDLKEVTFRNL